MADNAAMNNVTVTSARYLRWHCWLPTARHPSSPALASCRFHASKLWCRLTASYVRMHHAEDGRRQGGRTELGVFVSGIVWVQKWAPHLRRNCESEAQMSTLIGQHFDKQPHSTNIISHVSVFGDLTDATPDFGKKLSTTPFGVQRPRTLRWV